MMGYLAMCYVDQDSTDDLICEIKGLVKQDVLQAAQAIQCCGYIELFTVDEPCEQYYYDFGQGDRVGSGWEVKERL